MTLSDLNPGFEVSEVSPNIRTARSFPGQYGRKAGHLDMEVTPVLKIRLT